MLRLEGLSCGYGAFRAVDGLDENFIRASEWTTTGDIVLRPSDYPTDGLTWPVEDAKPVPAGLADRFTGHLAGRTLFQARRDYANARYQYIINTLSLKQAAGVLSPEDVMELNDWLQ